MDLRANPHLARAELLLEQRRYDLAEQHLRQALAADPDDPLAHSYLAICLSELERHTDATEEARRGIGLAPDSAFAHYVLARVLAERNLHKDALASVQQAIAFDPHNPSFWSCLAGIMIDLKRYPEGLDAAQHGLAIDPDDVACTNLRALALTGLGRKTQAADTVRTTLAREPDSAITHANMGWSLLHQSRPRPALDHFRESLRLDPTLEWAQHGIIEALKARWLIYRVMLRYFLFMSRLRGRAQWAIIIGGYLGYQAVRQIGVSNPAFKPWATAFIVAYLAFVAMSWLSVPLFNLLLMTSRFGRLTLARYHQAAAAALGLTILWVLAWAAAAWLTDHQTPGWFALISAPLIVPVAATANCRAGAGRIIMLVLLGLLALAAAGLIAVRTTGGESPVAKLAFLTFIPYMLVCFLSPLGVNVVNTLSPPVKK